MRILLVISLVAWIFTACAFDTSGLRPERESACDDGVDNDADGYVDCLDADCRETPACQHGPVEICNNGRDDDGDGDADCTDSDCASASNCQPVEICNNGMDDDEDGDVDCADPDCAQAPDCQLEEICDNGTDDDGDGDADCADPDCAQAPDCQLEEICDNGTDDDGDGDADCADPDCAQAPDCQLEEICDNGTDDDGDGDADCDDSDCAQAPDCQPENCTNGQDDDGDGAVDCNDLECVNTSACQTACDNITPISCGQSMLGSTANGYTRYTSYSCYSSNSGFTGPEVAFHLQVPAGNTATVRVNPQDLQRDLDIFLGSGTCSTTCTQYSINNPGQEDSITFVSSGNNYLIVDTWQNPGPFTISLTCATTVQEICRNGTDDDGDGYPDCTDGECLGGTNTDTCGDCNVFTNEGCSSLSSPYCVFDRATGYVGRCQTSQGAKTVGESCTSEAECAQGLFCNAAIPHECMRLCFLVMPDCPMGTACHTIGSWGSSPYGACY